jgi:cellulose synthase/poly-beta-1,6-N-acetylglucosamine synthase-like glycosyltransferase
MSTYAFGIENKMEDPPSDNFFYENIGNYFHGRVLEKICGRLIKEAKTNGKEYFCVCICIYNEELNDFENTVSSVLKNFEFMKRSTKFSNDKFGKSMQEKFNNLELLLVPIFDGITQKNDDDNKVKPIMKDSMMKWLNKFVFKEDSYIEKWRKQINEYLENLPQINEYLEKPPQITNTTHSSSVKALQSRLSHWFMVSPSSGLSLDISPPDKYDEESDYIYFYMAPIIKAQNHKKHNSHDWFFRGICEGLGQYCLYAFLTDVGTNYKVDCLAKLTYGLLYNHSLIGVTGRQRVALPGKYFLPCTEKECCFNSNDRPDFPFSSKKSFLSYCYWLVRSLEWYHFPWILFRFLWSLYILFINIVRILLYPIMSLFFSFWTRTEHKKNSIDDLPCFYCWLSYIFSLSLLQGFEFEGSLLLTSSPFNVIEALPVMPGPCQLFDWQKMNSRSIVKEYFNILLAGDDSRNIDFKKLSPSFAVNLATEPPESSIESDESKLICGVNLRESLEFNMRLAEDRILSFVSVLSGFGTKWISGATFYYQPELRIQSLIKQRRRWINGTFASFIYFFVSRRARNQVLGGFFDK